MITIHELLLIRFSDVPATSMILLYSIAHFWKLVIFPLFSGHIHWYLRHAVLKLSGCRNYSIYHMYPNCLWSLVTNCLLLFEIGIPNFGFYTQKLPLWPYIMRPGLWICVETYPRCFVVMCNHVCWLASPSLRQFRLSCVQVCLQQRPTPLTHTDIYGFLLQIRPTITNFIN